ncbi:single-stranded DNA-binding protein [Ruegeria arenilitoris]|uniref:single-stranded DNA-binding protein n=1 Tax=Ruegeria arenilitoris TaxID=1173585 RepID=UPI0014805C4E
MVSSVNKVILIGRMGTNPEIRHFDNSDRMCHFSLATNEGWKDRKTGEWVEITQWHRIVVRVDQIISFCEVSICRGDLVFVEGSLENRNWSDDDSQNRYATEVVLRPFKGQLRLLKKSEQGRLQAELKSDGGSLREPVDINDVPF